MTDFYLWSLGDFHGRVIWRRYSHGGVPNPSTVMVMRKAIPYIQGWQVRSKGQELLHNPAAALSEILFNCVILAPQKDAKLEIFYQRWFCFFKSPFVTRKGQLFQINNWDFYTKSLVPVFIYQVGEMVEAVVTYCVYFFFLGSTQIQTDQRSTHQQQLGIFCRKIKFAGVKCWKRAGITP